MGSLSTIQKKNTYLGLISILFWSFAAIAAVKLTSIPPFELLVCVFSIAFLVVAVRYSLTKDKKNFLNFTKLDLFVTSATLVVNHLCYYLAFRYSPAAEVDLINYLWPTMLILLSSFLPKEKFCFSYFLAAMVCLWGLYILLCPDFSTGISEENLLGYLFAFGSAVSWTAYSLYTRYRPSNSSNSISCACGVAAVFSLFAHISFEEFIFPGLLESFIIVMLGVFEVGLAYYFWDRALKNGSVKIMSLASYTIPLFSVLLLVLFGVAEFEQRMVLATLTISAAPLIPIIKNRWQMKNLSAKLGLSFIIKPFLKPIRLFVND
jgi:drug/metabolite transporter (DMT)-like permease